MRKKKIVFCAVALTIFMTGAVACATEKPSDMKVKESVVTTDNQVTSTTSVAKETEKAEEVTAAAAVTTKEAETETASTAVQEEKKTEGREEIMDNKTLQSVLAVHNMKAGTCLSRQMLNDDKCVEFIRDNFNSITFENDMKPDYILDREASRAAGDLVVRFNETTEEMLKWCADNGMSVRGHTLIWHSQTPDWIFYEDFDTEKEPVGREVMLARMESYISQVFKLLEDKGYIELFYAYDVVNEAWEDNGTKRNSLWLTTIGEDYLWHAFYFADKYAPEYIDLYYNDYNEQYKAETLCKFVKTLVDEEGNYLIDGIGLQAHLYTDDNVRKYLEAVEKLGSTGLKVCLTELDLCLGKYSAVKQPTEDNLKLQGRYYYNLVNGLLALADTGKVKMDSLTWWGFIDRLSWRSEGSPLLLGENYEPKYAYYGVLQMKDYAGFVK